jgi:hypothetical protein
VSTQHRSTGSKDHRSGTTRREVMKRSLYVAPAIMTFVVSPSFAQAASGDSGTSVREAMGMGMGMGM